MASFQYIQKHVIVGQAGCGKSSILVQLTDGRFLKDSEPTIGVEFGARVVDLGDNKRVKLQIWDTAGQESFRSITRSYYRGAEGALLVFDVTHRSSFAALPEWLEDLRQYCEENVQILVVGNKVDLDATDSSAKREVSSEEAREWAANNDCKYIETSAATGHNIVEAFELVARAIHELVQATSSSGHSAAAARSRPPTPPAPRPDVASVLSPRLSTMYHCDTTSNGDEQGCTPRTRPPAS